MTVGFIGAQNTSVTDRILVLRIAGRGRVHDGVGHGPPLFLPRVCEHSGVRGANVWNWRPRHCARVTGRSGRCSSPPSGDDNIWITFAVFLDSLAARRKTRLMSIMTDRLPADLPSGGLVIPDPAVTLVDPVTEPVLWVSDEPLNEDDAGRRWADLLSLHGTTGLWPLLLGAQQTSGNAPLRPWHNGELFPVPPGQADGIDLDELFAELREQAIEDHGLAEEGVPFDTWPWPAPGGEPGADPARQAIELVTSPSGIQKLLDGSGRGPFLGLTAALDGADAVSVCGWPSEAGGEECTAVLRSWQQRFGVRVCSLGFDTLGLSVARPPRTAEHARHGAVEHYTFCPDLARDNDFDAYAAGLVGATAWSLWWD